MNASPHVSRLATGAFVAGFLSLACGFVALAIDLDLLLLGIPLGFLVALALGISGRRAIQRSEGALTGAKLAAWGIALPLGGACLGFLLLPFT
jgi:hypothetical protein